jgi:RecB family exonuclease
MTLTTKTTTSLVYNKNEHIKLSTSSVSTFEQCPRRWFYRYVRKLYPDVEESEWTAFGNFIHDIAENFKDDCTLKEFKELVASRIKNYEFSEKYRNKVLPAIKNLFIYCKQNFKKDDIVLREKKIDFHYKGKFFLTGKIDIIHMSGNKVKVIDWKTSKEEKDSSFQLSFYKFLLEIIDLVKVESLECEIVYLCADQKDELLYVSKYNIEKDDVMSAIARIEALIKTYEVLGTENIEKWRMKTGPLCNYCDYFKSKDCPGRTTCN